MTTRAGAASLPINQLSGDLTRWFRQTILGEAVAVHLGIAAATGAVAAKLTSAKPLVVEVAVLMWSALGDTPARSHTVCRSQITIIWKAEGVHMMEIAHKDGDAISLLAQKASQRSIWKHVYVPLIMNAHLVGPVMKTVFAMKTRKTFTLKAASVPCIIIVQAIIIATKNTSPAMKTRLNI